MNKTQAVKLITKELSDLGVNKNSLAWKPVYDNAMEAFDVMTAKELKAYIQEYVDSLPNSYFQE